MNSRPSAARCFVLIGLLTLGFSVVFSATSSQASNPSTDPFLDGTEPLPPGTSIETVLSGMIQPTAMVFDPQGRLFYTERNTGSVRLFANGSLQSNPVITFSVNSSGERGLLGITLDPNFSSNRYVYVYYTSSGPSGPCSVVENRVVRFEENNGVGSNPTTIFTSCQSAGNHVGGNVHFGPDGKLYVTIGDNANPANSQNLNVTQGKIHRINSDGTIPPDNPFPGAGAPSIWAYGLRNSYDFTFDPLVPGRIFASENGPGCDDEMNRIERGYNYGWRSGYPCGDTDPTYNTILPLWRSAPCCIAPTGIAVYTGTQIPEWRNHLFMAGWVNGSLRHFYLDPAREQVTMTNVVLGVTTNMDIVTGPDGAFWYMQGGGYSNGTLRRIVGLGPTPTPAPSSTPEPPTATRTPTNTRLPTQTPGGPTATPEPPTATATPTPCAMSFNDVPQSNPFYPFIRCLACRDIISGYDCGGPNEPCPGRYFRWYNNVTRGQTSKIVASAAGFNEEVPPQQQTFADVPGTHPFWLWIERLGTRGIISGYDCGGAGEPCDQRNRPYFRAQNDVTRGQLAKIVAEAADMGEEPSGQTFEDVPSNHPFYRWVEQVASRDIISGYNCGGPNEPCNPPANRPYFRPFNTATRGQSSKIVASTFFPVNCVPGAEAK